MTLRRVTIYRPDHRAPLDGVRKVRTLQGAVLPNGKELRIPGLQQVQQKANRPGSPGYG